jgi:hypothetical protein
MYVRHPCADVGLGMLFTMCNQPLDLSNIQSVNPPPTSPMGSFDGDFYFRDTETGDALLSQVIIIIIIIIITPWL